VIGKNFQLEVSPFVARRGGGDKSNAEAYQKQSKFKNKGGRSSGTRSGTPQKEEALRLSLGASQNSQRRGRKIGTLKERRELS